jgi:uncharacterized RDD family membrane protein YckC
MKIKCPACGKVLSVPETAAGKVVQCPCGKQLRVPGAATPQSGAPVSPAPGAARPTGSSVGSFGTDTSAFDELTDRDLEPVRSGANPLAKPAQAGPGGNDPLHGYAPPTAGGALGGRVAGGVRASLSQRIVGALVDAFLQMGFTFLGIAAGIAIGILIDSQDPSVAAIFVYLGVGAGVLVVPIINAYLISISGQSVGKKVAKTRIVDLQSGEQSRFVQGFLIRNFVFGMITSIPCIGPIIALADLIMLFPEPHETLHDKLAKTAVVQA